MAKIKIKALKDEPLDERLKALGLSVEGTLPERAERLTKWMQSQKFSRNLIADCTVCNGSSLAEWPSCPYCGDTEIEFPEGAKPAKATKGEAKPKPEAKPKGGKPSNDPERVNIVVLTPDEKKLDDAVSKLVEIRRGAIGLQWDFCTELKRIFDEKLWMHRKGRDGKPRHKAWNAFVSQEIKITPSYSYQLMDIAKNFDREQLSELGVKKLVMMLRLPDEQRQNLLSNSEGQSADQLRAQIGSTSKASGSKTGSTSKAPTPRPVGSKSKSSKAPDAPTPIRETERVTVAIELGRKRLEMMARPKNEGDPATMPAKRLSDEPFAVDTLINGVQAIYRVVTDEHGSMILVIEHRRDVAR